MIYKLWEQSEDDIIRLKPADMSEQVQIDVTDYDDAAGTLTITAETPHTSLIPAGTPVTIIRSWPAIQPSKLYITGEGVIKSSIGASTAMRCVHPGRTGDIPSHKAYPGHIYKYGSATFEALLFYTVASISVPQTEPGQVHKIVLTMTKGQQVTKRTVVLIPEKYEA